MTTLFPSGCADTLTDRLRALAGSGGDGPAVTTPGPARSAGMGWAQLDAAADAVAAWVGSRCAPGDRVAVVMDNGPLRVAAFLGVLRAAHTAVPLDLPVDEAGADLLVAAVLDCDPAMVLTTWDHTASLRSLLADVGARVLPADALPAPEDPPDAVVRPTEPACLAYVDDPGSWLTGVRLTHADLWTIAVRTADALVSGTSTRVVVTGLSLASPLGLALGIGVPAVTGLRSVLLDPRAVVREPHRWVAALAANPHCATAAPSASFDQAGARSTREQRAGLRLDGVEALLDLGGAVQHSGVDRFLTAFADCGLSPAVKRTAYAPWGLPPVVSAGAGVRAVGFDTRGLGRGEAVPAGFSRPVSVLSSSGRPDPGSVRVADPATGAPRADGRVGEIQVRGIGVDGLHRGGGTGSATSGARSRTKGAQAAGRVGEGHIDGVGVGGLPGSAVEGGWLWTGDLGVLRRGGLYVLGPAAEAIAVGGMLLLPREVERVAEVAHPAVLAGGAAAFSVPDPGGPRVVVVVERSGASRAGVATGVEVANAVRAAVGAAFGGPAVEVVLVEAGDAPRCAHGGVLRLAARDRHLTGPGSTR